MATDVRITREWLLARCEPPTEGDEHLLWRLRVGQRGPVGHYKDGTRDGAQFLVRRAAWALWHPGARKLTLSDAIVPACGLERCLSEHCLERRVHGGYNRGHARPLHVRAKIAKTIREKMGIAPEMVLAIKERTEAGETPKAIADSLGAPFNTVCFIARGDRWGDIEANPWSGLLR